MERTRQVAVTVLGAVTLSTVLGVPRQTAPPVDAHDRTFSGPGRVGVWTKADSYTVFDDLTASPRGP